MSQSKFEYNSLLFRNLRIIVLEPSKKEIRDEDIVKAVTLNENIKSLGYCFSPDSFGMLSRSNIDDLYEIIVKFVGTVDAEPMCPGFPNEVMKMDEATYRFHQILHYMSTYGLEYFTGQPVSKGWMPESEKVNRDKSDTFKTDLKTIEVISSDEMYVKPVSRLLSRKSRLTEADTNLIRIGIKELTVEQMMSLEVPFKENVLILFNIGVEEKDIAIMKAACKNTMDAFKCVKNLLSANKWHLKTSQKRLVAKLLDTYDNYSFEENLMYSNTRREMIIRILDHIDYTTYSRNDSHKNSVALLKDKKLHSWMSTVEKEIEKGKMNQVHLMLILKKRPGMFLRMCVRLIRLGYSPAIIQGHLCDVASELSTQTIIDLLNFNYQFKSADVQEEWATFHNILLNVLQKKLETVKTDLYGKKIWINAQDYDFKHSMILKSDEGGYNRGGLAFAIPEDANVIRFFVYWNDVNRIDVDLHANFKDLKGELYHVGWNGDYYQLGVATSGDITHSDAAEYIDIDMRDSSIDAVSAVINVYTEEYFSEIDTCFAGLMGVSDLEEDVKLYDPKACFVSQELTSKTSCISYGIISVKERFIRYLGTECKGIERSARCAGSGIIDSSTMFSVDEYLKILFKSQHVEIVEDRSEADLTLALAKGEDVSMIDRNFYVDL